MRGRLKTVSFSALGVCAALALGTNFTWTGNGSDDLWSNCDNWTGGTFSHCFPNDGLDNAVIPAGSSTWTIDLVTETIANLYIHDHTDFGAASGSPTLTVGDQMSIYGQSAGNGDTVVTMTGATIDVPE